MSFNPYDAGMISTIISFDNLHNINVCMKPGKMNGYAEAPGQTSLLKMSKIVVKPIGPESTLTPPPYCTYMPPALSSAHPQWNDTNAMKKISRGAIEVEGITDSRYL